jgi:SM-20-related protein
VITYLNPDIKVAAKNAGDLRLFLPDRILDVAPHIGRTIIFKSEIVEHEVRPTQGY